MEKELHFPPAIEPNAVYDVDQVAALLQMGVRSVERLPLSWFFIGTRTRRVMGSDLLAYVEVLKERDAVA
jgi:hypothetical protein